MHGRQLHSKRSGSHFGVNRSFTMSDLERLKRS